MIKRFCDRCSVELITNLKTVLISTSEVNVQFEKDDFSEIAGIYCRKCADMVSDILESEPDQDAKEEG